MASVLEVVGGFGSFVVVQEEGVVGVGEDDVLPQEGRLQEGVVLVYFLEDVVIPVHESKLRIALRT